METSQPMRETAIVPPFLPRRNVADFRSGHGVEKERRRKSPGRPPGIQAERRRALAEMAQSGLTLAEMAAALGVSRQCIHQQLAKCPSISIERRALHEVRRQIERTHRLRERALHRARKHSAHGAALARFLREAMARGWSVEAAPGRRPHINGVLLAFHTPHRTRTSSATSHARHLSRYYHIKLARPEWLHVVCFPTGVYAFYLPDPARHAGSIYIPVSVAQMRQPWPEWPKLRDRRRSIDNKQARKSGHTSSSAWAA